MTRQSLRELRAQDCYIINFYNVLLDVSLRRRRPALGDERARLVLLRRGISAPVQTLGLGVRHRVLHELADGGAVGREVAFALLSVRRPQVHSQAGGARCHHRVRTSRVLSSLAHTYMAINDFFIYSKA